MRYKFVCAVCQDVLLIDQPSQVKAQASARAHGWSTSRALWVCNWHARAFSVDAAHDLAALIDRAGLPRPRREWRFGKWSLDFFYTRERLAIEVEGGVWLHGRHNRGTGFTSDIIKYNALTLADIHLLRYTPDMLRDASQDVITQIIQMLNAKNEGDM